MWMNRDDLLHNVHTGSGNRLSCKLDKRLRKEFSIDMDGLAPIRHYMVRRTKLELLLLWDNTEKAAWLATIKLAHIAWKRKIRQSKQQRRMLRESLQPP
jgi:hypothetical protein